MLNLSTKRGRSIKLRFFVCCQYESDTQGGAELFAEDCCEQVVLLVVQTSVVLPRQITIVVPLVARRAFGIGSQEVERRCACKGNNSCSVLYRVDLHTPISCVSARVEVAIVHQGFPFQLDR